MINVMYCGNYKVFDGILISLLSMRLHTEEPINCYILTMDLSSINSKYRPINEKMRLYLDAILKEKNKDSNVFLKDLTETFKNDTVSNKNIESTYTPYALLRLYANKIEGIPDKILYLDIDTIINNDIKELFDIDITNYELAAARDVMGKIFININYCNSGVLLLNMKKIKETNLLDRTRELIKVKKMSFPDQSALHRLTKYKLIIPRKFNEQRKTKPDTVVKHFCKGIRWLPFYKVYNIKPWEIDKVHSFLKCYCYDDILKEYQVKLKIFLESED